MEGCLSTLIKLMILAGLFIVGLVGGYFYYQGFFDSYLVRHAMNGMPKLKPAEALPLVDPNATPEAAYKDLSAVDRKWVVWRGQVSETRSISGDLTQLTLLTLLTPRRIVVVFADHTVAPVDGRVGDEVEVLGWSRKTLVLSEDREGKRYPQVLALKVSKPAPAQVIPPPAEETDVTAHGAEPENVASPAPVGTAAPASAAAPAAPALAPSPAGSPRVAATPAAPAPAASARPSARASARPGRP